MRARHRWFALAVFYALVLLHQADKLLIGPLTTPIMEEFGINQAQMGAVSSLAIIISAVLYPLWGYLYDRYARPKLLSLASFIWGTTTWLNALARSYGVFLVTRASTGIDDSSYPGIYSLLADYFGPRIRGKIYGLLQTAMPFGYMLGLVLATTLGGALGWRRVFFVTGGLGVLVSVIIYWGVRDAPRGSAEPEMEGLEQVPVVSFKWAVAKETVQKPSMRHILIQGCFGVFPWNVLTYWFFRYLEVERGFSGGEATTTMMVAIVALAAGYFVGGALGDSLFKRTPRGRVLVAVMGVVLGMVLMVITLNVLNSMRLWFTALMGLTGITMSWSTANVSATIQDITEPEVRSTAYALTEFISNTGAALSPWLAGFIADRSSLRVAILGISVGAWLLCAGFFALLAGKVSGDIEHLRATMRRRAERAAVSGTEATS